MALSQSTFINLVLFGRKRTHTVARVGLEGIDPDSVVNLSWVNVTLLGS